jgi:hypothetical protein
MARHQPSWRERFKIHPFADTFPMLSGPARAELREDIRKHGVREPIVLWLDNREVAESGDINRSAGEGVEFLVDGRNRLEVADELGIEPPIKRMQAYRLTSRLGRKPTSNATRWEASVPDVEALILSLNVHRRHLTAAQKTKAIEAYDAVDPMASDRKIARHAGVSPTFVGKVRNGTRNVHGGQKSTPRERAKQAVLANPSLSNVELAKTANVSEFTVRTARKDLGQPKPKRATPAPDPVRDPVLSRLARELTKLADEQVENLAHIDASEVSAKAVNTYAAKVDETYAALTTHIERLRKESR